MAYPTLDYIPDLGPSARAGAGATKLLWLALRNVMSKSVRSTREWKIAMNQFAILYAERFTARTA